MKAQTYLAVLVTALIGISGPWAAAQDIDDVEADMDTALAESDAAQSEASDAQKREEEEKANLHSAKEQAHDTVAKAKAKELEAAREIKILEGKINVSRQERARFDKVRKGAEKRIVTLDQRIANRRSDLEAARAASEAARVEKEAHEKIERDRTQEKAELDKQIAREREATKAILKTIGQLKAQEKKLQAELAGLRKIAMREAEKRARAKTEAETIQRRVASIPRRVVVRKSIQDCDVSEVASDAALVVGKIRKGTQHEIYRVVEKRWVEVQVGARRGFAPRSCF